MGVITCRIELIPYATTRKRPAKTILSTKERKEKTKIHKDAFAFSVRHAHILDNVPSWRPIQEPERDTSSDDDELPTLPPQKQTKKVHYFIPSRLLQTDEASPTGSASVDLENETLQISSRIDIDQQQPCSVQNGNQRDAFLQQQRQIEATIAAPAHRNDASLSQGRDSESQSQVDDESSVTSDAESSISSLSCSSFEPGSARHKKMPQRLLRNESQSSQSSVNDIDAFCNKFKQPPKGTSIQSRTKGLEKTPRYMWKDTASRHLFKFAIKNPQLKLRAIKAKGWLEYI